MNPTVRNSVRALAAMLLSLGLSACQTLLNPQVDDLQAKARIDRHLNDIERTCVGRDVSKNPFPALGSSTASFISPREYSCQYWSSAPEVWGNYSRSFLLYGQRDYFINEVKKRFGVIYHHSGPVVNSTGHTMLLRDGRTVLRLSFTNGRKSTGSYYQEYTFWLSPYFNTDESSPYVLTRLRVMNLERLSDEEKQQVAEEWERNPDKAAEAERIARAIDSIRTEHAYYAEREAEFSASERAFNERREQERKAANASLNRALMQAFSTPGPTSAGSGGFNPASPRITTSLPARVPVTPAAFDSIRGFNAAQLPSSIDRSKLSTTSAIKPLSVPAASKTTGTSSQASHKASNAGGIRSSSATGVSKQRSKVYEPVPEIARGNTETWFADRSYAVELARLGAVSDISARCSAKGARVDRPSSSQIKSGTAPVRWSFSVPDCQQGGWEGREWKCNVEVAGTCYRMQ